MKRITILILLFWVPNIFAQTAETVLQSKLNAIHTMSASFKQDVKAKKRHISNSRGTMAMSRPGRFRWQTKSPMEQLVVADGSKLWVYDVDLEQVTVRKQEKGIGGTAGLFLSGYNDTVARDFKVTQSKHGNDDHFDLHPKSSKSNFQRVRLMFHGDALIGMELYDQLGQQTKVHLSNVKINPKLSSSLFKFKAPKGVDVVRQ